MYIQKQDIEKILEIMNEFPDAGLFQLVQETGSGIGSTLSLFINTTINERNAEVKIEISGVGNW